MRDTLLFHGFVGIPKQMAAKLDCPAQSVTYRHLASDAHYISRIRLCTYYWPDYGLWFRALAAIYIIVGQYSVVLQCEVKWWRFVALFK